MSKEAMKLTVEAITQYFAESPDPSEEAVEGLCDARAILRKALAEQPAQQEPYCYTYTENGEEYFAPPTAYVPDHATPLYTSPPAQRTWVGLTDANTEHLWEISRAAMPRYHTFKTLIEKALKEKNT